MRIVLHWFGDVPAEVLKGLAVDLQMFDADCEMGGKLSIPPESYNRKREQYRSDTLLDKCAQQEGDRVLSVASVDMFSEPLNFVFGQAQINGRAAVISIARLGHRKRDIFRDRVAKEAIHELGHTFGLVHCTDPNCVMYFSNSLSDTDRKGKRYCPSCTASIPTSWKPKRKSPESY